MRVLDAVVRLSPVLEPRQELRLEDLFQIDQRWSCEVRLIGHNTQEGDIPAAQRQPRQQPRKGVSSLRHQEGDIPAAQRKHDSNPGRSYSSCVRQAHT